MDKEISQIGRNIGSRILYWCDQRNMNQHALSIQAGITEPKLSAIISGKQIPKADTLARIAQALNISWADIQPNELDQYNEFLPESRQVNELLKHMSPSQRKKIIETISFMKETWV